VREKSDDYISSQYAALSLSCRFYSKLHKRWLQELGGTGVTHLVSLFLTLASAGNTEEVVSVCVCVCVCVGVGECLLVWVGAVQVSLSSSSG